MPTFTFTIGPLEIAQLHDALSCLAKFDENISLEANATELRISSLNSTKTAHASFILDGAQFFERYQFYSLKHDSSGNAARAWACKLQNRALMSIFKKRQADNKEKETSIERCEFELQARPDVTECRLIFKLFCHFSVVKTYRLTYEPTEVLHATFDKNGSLNTWTIPARAIRDVVDYFGPKTEHVDWSLHDDKVTFTSYTDKVQVGREIIRQPTHTSVTLDDRDFDECKIEPDLHLSIPVKDFRSIIAHAETMKAIFRVTYSHGHRPAQFTYGSGGLSAQFTLMTKGTSNTAIDSSRTTTPARGLSVRPTSQSAPGPNAPTAPTPTEPPIQKRQPPQNPVEKAPEPARPKKATSTSIDTSAPPASINPDSLFFPAAEHDDNQWNPPAFDDDQDMVTWASESVFDPSALIGRRLRDATSASASASFRSVPEGHRSDNMAAFGIPPTQRLSQVKGLFD